MAVRGPSPWLRRMLSALLLLQVRPTRAQSAPSNSSSVDMEVDLISPVAGETYRINQDRGLHVVIAIHNKQVADDHDWAFTWTAKSTAVQPNGVLAGLGTGAVGTGAYEDAYTIQDKEPYIILNHPYLFSGTNKPFGEMPPGEYIFEWKFDLGPWCGSGAEYSIGHTVAQGNFSIFLDEDAPWPAFTPTSCASLAGQVAFATTSVRDDVAFDHGTPLPIACAITQNVTETPQPCLATVDAARAASISSIMTWVDGAAGSPATTSTSGQTASTAGVVIPTQTPSLAGDLRPMVYCLVACFAGLILAA